MRPHGRRAFSGPLPTPPTVCARRKAMMIIPALLLGIVVTLVRRPSAVGIDGLRPDVPLRVLGWTVDLLSAERQEWGRAMLGELAQIEGGGRRWRFAVGCMCAAVLMPPWGRAGAAAAAIVGVASGGLGLYAVVVIRYGLGALAWVWAAVVLGFLLGMVLAAVALLRRP